MEKSLAVILDCKSASPFQISKFLLDDNGFGSATAEELINVWYTYMLSGLFFRSALRFQYQLMNLFWLSFDFFSLSWSFTICFFVAFIFLCVLLYKNITKCFLFVFIHIFSTYFAVNLFYYYTAWKRKQTTLFFYKNNFIRTKALVLQKKIKNKLRTKPALLSRRT